MYIYMNIQIKCKLCLCKCRNKFKPKFVLCPKCFFIPTYLHTVLSEFIYTKVILRNNIRFIRHTRTHSLCLPFGPVFG